MKPNNLMDNFYKKVFQGNNANNASNGVLNENSDEDSSDDEDFVISDKGDSDQSTDNSSDSSNSEDTSSEREKDSESSEEDNKKTKNLISNNGSKQINGKYTKHKSPKKVNDIDEHHSKNQINKTANNKVIPNKNICCVCLNEQSESSDELVECDSCGFYTHEGCYGISDSDSKDSSDSIASTEPWFCNSCLVSNSLENSKAQINKITNVHNCELCPNLDCGLLKETESGKFVHIVCALYSPEVSFEDTDKLWPVVLNEIPSKKWGEKICSLCDNILYSRTGVCIKCDAGLCKAYFHATCAMKHGLTVDPMQQNIDDPFFAYCKQHNDSTQIKHRKSKYAVMIASFQSKTNNSNENRERIKVKFKNARINYQLKRESAQIPRQEKRKASRMLTTCPSALKALMHKSKTLNGALDEYDHSVNGQQKHSVNAVTFTSDFVKYYYEREKKLDQFNRELPDLKKSQQEMTQEEVMLRSKYEAKLEERKKIIETYNKNSKLLTACIGLVDKQKIKNSLNQLLNIDNIKQPLNETKSEEVYIDDDDDSMNINISSLNSSRRSSTTTLNNTASKRAYIKRKSSFTGPAISLDAECSTCHLKTNSHLLVECDTCKTYYHINCLDPPLSTVPKKSKLYGWECAKCVRKKDSDYEDEEQEAEPENETNKRPLRRERKQTRSGFQETFEMEQLLKLAKKKSKKENKKRSLSKSHKREDSKSPRNSNKKLKNEEQSAKEDDVTPKKKKNYYVKKKFRNENNQNSDRPSKSSTIDNSPVIDSIIESVIAESVDLVSNEQFYESEKETIQSPHKKKLKV